MRPPAAAAVTTVVFTTITTIASDTNGGDEHSSSSVGLGVGWIEREMTAVKHCYEDEIRLLDSEVSDLRVQLRPSRSFTAELRRRYEDSMKFMCRSGLETLLQQLEHLRQSAEGWQSEKGHLTT